MGKYRQCELGAPGFIILLDSWYYLSTGALVLGKMEMDETVVEKKEDLI